MLLKNAAGKRLLFGGFGDLSRTSLNFVDRFSRQMMTQNTVKWGHSIAATLLAICLVFVGAKFADQYHLPLIHGWLMHGAVIIVFPIYWLASYCALLPVRHRLETPGADYRPPERLSFLAVGSVILAGSGFLVPIVGSLLGIVLGHLARYRIKTRTGLTGSGIAIFGLVLGYLGLAYSVYVVWMVSLASRRAG
jgi:hypothetical protein